MAGCRARGRKNGPAAALSARHLPGKRRPACGVADSMPRKPPRPKSPTPIEAIRHQETRVNIPTEELRDFVVKDEEKPRTVLYPRDPTLDPQLVWRARTSRTPRPLAVPVVPIYIQEKIHPQALVENLRKTAKAGELEPEQLLFADFNGLPDEFDRRVDFYSHESASQPHWSNRMILGDSLHGDDEPRREGRPQGPGPDDLLRPALRHQVRLELAGLHAQARREGRQGGGRARASRSRSAPSATPGSSASTRTSPTCATGSTVARDLLTDTGSIFVQIGDENVHLVRCVLDEVFGSENFVARSPSRRRARRSMASDVLGVRSDYLLWYAKDARAREVPTAVSSRSRSERGGRRTTTWLRLDGLAAANDALTNATDSATRRGSGSRLPRRQPAESEHRSRERRGCGVWFHVESGASFTAERSERWKTTPRRNGADSMRARVEATGDSSSTTCGIIDDFPVFAADRTSGPTRRCGFQRETRSTSSRRPRRSSSAASS